MRILGVDYGKKKIGIAISDEDGKIAFPKSVIDNKGKVAEAVYKIAKELQTSFVVIGDSRDFRGEDNIIMHDVRTLEFSLKKLGLKVALEPEFLTSLEAERLQGKGPLLDASAAALILQRYLDKHIHRDNN